jgi:hypothetical protein
MAITTLDGVIAGAKPAMPFVKTGATMSAVGGMRGYTFWYAAGVPGASVATTIGINGEAVNSATTSATTIAGRIPRIDQVSPAKAYLSRLGVTASQPGVLMLIDRLYHQNGIPASNTVATPITAPALPPRDRNETANGTGVMAAIEWSASGGAGTPTVTLTYKNSAGATGKTGTFTAVATPPAGTFEIFTLAAGDIGVQAPTSFVQSATRTSGTMHLVLFRIIAQLEITAANIGNAIDALTAGMPEIYPFSVLQFVWIPSSTTAVNIMGTYLETHG